MRVTFRAIEGSMTGREFILRPAQLLQVGRTDWADVAFPDDGHMSGIHFAVETDLKSCYIKDLDGTNGTFLNSRRVNHRQAVADGDIVVAGDTSFEVRIDRGDADTGGDVDMRKTEPKLSADLVPRPARPAPRRSEQPPAYTAEKCDSGLTLCRGGIAVATKPDTGCPAADVALRLSEKFAAHLMVDFRRLGQPLPKDLPSTRSAGGPEFLFDWLDPDVAAVASPVLVSQYDLATWPEVLESGRGKDAVVCLFSNRERAEVWSHLRRTCRVGHPRSGSGCGDGPPTAVLGICWPTVLVAILSHHVAYAKQLFQGIDAILTEFPDLPDTWQLFGTPTLPDELDALGFEREGTGKDSRLGEIGNGKQQEGLAWRAAGAGGGVGGGASSPQETAPDFMRRATRSSRKSTRPTGERWACGESSLPASWDCWSTGSCSGPFARRL